MCLRDKITLAYRLNPSRGFCAATTANLLKIPYSWPFTHSNEIRGWRDSKALIEFTWWTPESLSFFLSHPLVYSLCIPCTDLPGHFISVRLIVFAQWPRRVIAAILWPDARPLWYDRRSTSFVRILISINESKHLRDWLDSIEARCSVDFCYCTGEKIN